MSILKSIHARLLFSFLILAAVTGVTGAVGVWMVDRVSGQGDRVGVGLAPLADAAMEIQLTATKAHLVLEEVMGGDAEESIDDVKALLGESRWYARALLEGGSNDEGTFRASDDPRVREQAEKLLPAINDLAAQVDARYALLAQQSGVGSGADQQFDALYEDAQAGLAALIERARGLPDSEAVVAINALGLAKYHLANAHLILEELLSGDDEIHEDDVVNGFQSAVDAMAGIASPGLRGAGAEVVDAIKDIAALARTRIGTNAQASADMETAEIAFDAAYENFLKLADAVEELVHDGMGDGVEAMYRAGDTATMSMIGVAVVGFGLALFFAHLANTGVSRRITGLSVRMRALAQSDTSGEIGFVRDQDEIGDMARAVQVFKDNMIAAERLTKEKEIADRRKEESGQKVRQLIAGFDSTIKGVLESLLDSDKTMSSTAREVKANAEQTKQETTTVAAAAEQASRNVETVSSAAEELTASIQEINRNVSQAAEVSGKANIQADQTSQQIRVLEENVTKIGAVVSLINDIASQTNLLALNATIEAARAGEAGKGFAVVASEVKNLANQTSRATEEISGQIAQVQASTQEAVQAIGDITRVIKEINEISASISAAMEEQGAATREIARNVEEAATGTHTVSSSANDVRALAEQSDTSAGSIATVSSDLSRQTEALREHVTRFLREVQQASNTTAA